MFANSSSIFKQIKVPKEVNLSNPEFIRRLQLLERKVAETHDIEVTPSGWKCKPKSEGTPGYVINMQTVLFVMKNLGI